MTTVNVLSIRFIRNQCLACMKWSGIVPGPSSVFKCAMTTICILAISSHLTADETAGTFRGDHSLKIRTTANGVTFGMSAEDPTTPMATVFILNGNSIKDALDDRFAGHCGRKLAESGYLCVSIDLPCHGDQQRPDEPKELSGWCHRTMQSEDFVADSNRRLTSVLDYLIESKRTDPKRVAVCGTSRGGFLALHFAAHDRRVCCAVAFAPVTDLMTLREFQGQPANLMAKSLALATNVEHLIGRPVWIVIGDQDERVGTDRAIGFARQITKESLKSKVPSRVELHVVPEPRGHTLPDDVSDNAANWIQRQLD